MMRPDSGISSPLSFFGYPVPSQRSWWESAISAPIFVNGVRPYARMLWPISVCLRMSTHSSAVNEPALRRIESGTPIFPTSCMGAA